MSETPYSAEALNGAAGAVPNGLDPDAHPFEAAAAVAADLAQDARSTARCEADKRELRVALRDLADGLRGMIRVAPLASVAAAMTLALVFSRRRGRRPAPRRA